MSLTTNEQILIEQRVANDAPSAGVAYLLWVFLGGLGGHRYYLGRTGSAVAMTLLFVAGFATAAAGIGLLILGGIGIWALIDAFTIPGMIRAKKDELRRSYAAGVQKATS